MCIYGTVRYYYWNGGTILLEKRGGLDFFFFLFFLFSFYVGIRWIGWMHRMHTCASAGNGILPYPTAEQTRVKYSHMFGYGS